MRTEFLPNWTSPPGNTIKDLLKLNNFQKERLGLPEIETDQLLSGELFLTLDIAEKLEGLFGTPISFWLKREEQYREDLKRLGI